jgi:citrate lyase beta subunit
MSRTLSDSSLTTVLERLKQDNEAFELRYPGDSRERQPIHVVYGGAQRFKSDTAKRMGTLALETLRVYAPDAETLAGAAGMELRTAEVVYPKVVAKLVNEPVEDFRIDFEDGYGYRADGEEDAHATDAAIQLARAMREGKLPPFTGIRIKPLTRLLERRAMRTLDLFLTNVLENTGKLPEGFVVTLPKVTAPVQVSVLDEMLLAFEQRYGLAARSTKIELMIETPQLIVNSAGVCAIPALLEASLGRCRGLHFGPYDYTSSLNITSSNQSLAHPACDLARQMMLIAAAGSGVFVANGPTKLLPVPLFRGQTVTPEQEAANREAVHRGMRAHYDDIRRSLHDGYYQGWDLHPAQLPTRYAATYAFFVEGREAASQRLRNLLADAEQATLSGALFDDTASGQGLLNFFLRGYVCGAFTTEDITGTGLTLDDVRRRSFYWIQERRRESR